MLVAGLAIGEFIWLWAGARLANAIGLE